MENTTEEIATMPEKSYSEDEIEASYAEEAAELAREAKERQEIDAVLRKSSNRIRGRDAGVDKLGNPVPGMWSVIVSIGEPYEPSYDRAVGLFNVLAEAERYCEALDAELNIASGKTINQYASTLCWIEFTPFGETNPVFHTLYTVETERDDNNAEQRTITGISADTISEKNLLKMIGNGDNPRLAAIWADKSLAVSLDNETEKPSQEIVSSEIFSMVETITGKYDDGTPYSYIESYERFLTFDPANVVLNNPNKA